MSQSGPCVICGATNYSASFGGHYNGAALAVHNARLTSKLQAVQADAASWKADAAGLHLENVRLREVLERIDHRVVFGLDGSAYACTRVTNDVTEIARAALATNPAGEGTGSSSADVALSRRGDGTETAEVGKGQP